MIRKTEVGQTLVLAAVAMVALLGVAGLAIDMGVLRYDKRLQQTAADAAALAGASNLPSEGSTGIIGGALTASAQNGFTNNAGSGDCATPNSDLAVGAVEVTVCNPPIAGPHAGDTKYVEAYVSAGQPTFFMKVLGVTRRTVIARAVATNVADTGPGAGCLWTLGPPSASIEGVNVNGNPTLNAPTCGITDNGDFNTKGNALVVQASSFTASGTWVNDGTKPGDVTCTSGGACPQYPTPAIEDPLSATLATAPQPGTPTYTVSISGNANPNCGNGCTYDSTSNTYFISPTEDANGNVVGGYYCSITINGVAQDKVVFNPGIYIIEGTDDGCTTQSLNIPGNATISGDGVMFYFTGTSTLNMTGTPLMQLTGLPAGSLYPGMLMWQDPNDPNTTGPSLGGNSGSYYDGMLYFPSDQLTFYGNNTSMDVAMVITYSMQLSGNPTVNFQGASALPPGSDPLVVPTLVE